SSSVFQVGSQFRIPPDKNEGRRCVQNSFQSSADSEMSENMELQALLEEYADVFEEPKTLPPHRSFDHQIPLRDGDVDVKVRPCRYPPAQKDVIKTMVKELLDSGLNKFTNKDKFPIPVIEELIDELLGAQVFSKLDLSSGYHQIRMKEEDVYKTAFRLEGIAASLAQLLFQQQYANRGDVNSRFSRLGKMEFPKFHGEDEKGLICAKRFGDANEVPMAELKNLGYKTTMKQYQSDFEALLNQVNIIEAQAISIYIAGLPATIEINVRMFKPRSLGDAFSLSSLQETTLALVKQRYTPILSTPRTTTNTFVNRNVTNPAKNTSTLALPAPISQTVTKSNAMFRSRPRKMLSQKEYDEKRSKNQCFYCDQKYIPGHKCERNVYYRNKRGKGGSI
nr:reverse transcriptase [Tanacetum cinerariifolium]